MITQKLCELGAKIIIKIFQHGFLVKIHILPGGTMPERKSHEAEGYDVFLRAVVSAYEMDTKNPVLRKPLFDFKNLSTEQSVLDHIENRDGKLVYRLDPGGSALVGIGFATQMPFPMFSWTAPRSGLAAKHRITLSNAHGTIDSDYRGEAGIAIKNEGEEPFYLEYNMRIAQMLFQVAIIPQFTITPDHDDLGGTARGAGGFGSTGLK